MYQIFKVQRGSALIVSLLILLVLTLIGVTSMSTTSLQSKMATNSREYNLAFQAAESALRDGETDMLMTNPTVFDSSCTTGLCLPSTVGTPVWSSGSPYWASARLYGSQTGAAALSFLATPPKYLIEKLPLANPTVPGRAISNLPNYGSGGLVQYYRVTAFGTGGNGSAAVMVQSIYQ